MSCELAIQVESLDKCYPIYTKPIDRLKQLFYSALFRVGIANLRKYYKEFWALRGISLSINRGETVGIIGRNGSGKSTLLQLICGTLSPTNGYINTKGRVAALLELGSGFNPEFTGRENVYLNAEILGLERREIDDRIDAILEFSGIGEFVDRPVKSYSSGMMLRLAFSVIAHVDADILIIDEALAVGDAFFTQKCMRFLRNFMQKGTVLFVSHDTTTVRSLCDRAIWLEGGRLVMEGRPKEVSEKYLEALYASSQDIINATPKFQAKVKKPTNRIDQRALFINNSCLRNDIKIFEFNTDANSFGKGGAKIINVSLHDEKGNLLSWVVGGESVMLKITASVYVEINSPIIGFFVSDRFGQNIFGDNTWLSYCDTPLKCKAGCEVTANFSFDMPRIPAGDYSITVAFAEGSQTEHVQHDWIHDALIIRSESTSVASGLIGIPMSNIEMNCDQL